MFDVGISRAYLDTYYLLEIVLGGRHKRYVERLPSQISSRFMVLIPQIVLGEAISQIYEKRGDGMWPDKLMERFTSVMNKYGWDNSNMPPPPNWSFQIMDELLRVDDRLEGTDVVILAQALADPDSKFLFTRDRTLGKNENVCNYELRLRQSGRRNTKLKITELLR